jgi:hypothetical protein
MNEVWRNLKPNFIISTGRTGTKFLVYFFNALSKEIDARHEPKPNLLKLKWQFGTGKITLEKAMKIFQKEKMGLYKTIKKPYYIESNPRLRYFIPIIKQIFPNYKIVHIIRDGRDWVRSAMNRGIYSSIIDIIPTPVIKFLRFIIPDNISLPQFGIINLQAYYRDLWRFSIDDFTEKTYHKKWTHMTQFEKLSWNWNRYTEEIYYEIRENANIITVKFEDIFDRENQYRGLKKITNFFELDDFWEDSDLNLDVIFSKKINISKTYNFPHWKNWKKAWLIKFEEIAGNSMNLYEY